MRVVAPLRARGAHIEGRAKEGEVTAPLVIGPLPAGRSSPRSRHEPGRERAGEERDPALGALRAWARPGSRSPRLARSHRAHAASRSASRSAPWAHRSSSTPRDGAERWRAFRSSPRRCLCGGVPPRRRADHAGLAGDGAPRRHEPDAHRASSRIARHMGAGLEVVPAGEQCRGAGRRDPRRGIDALRRLVGGEIVPRAIDEIPIACALAARAPARRRSATPTSSA